MRRRRDFDPARWAAETARRHGGRGCAICASPKWSETIDRVLEVMARKGDGPSLSQIREMLYEHFGFDQSVGAVKRHVSQHRAALWARARKAVSSG